MTNTINLSILKISMELFPQYVRIADLKDWSTMEGPLKYIANTAQCFVIFLMCSMNEKKLKIMSDVVIV